MRLLTDASGQYNWKSCQIGDYYYDHHADSIHKLISRTDPWVWERIDLAGLARDLAVYHDDKDRAARAAAAAARFDNPDAGTW